MLSSGDIDGDDFIGPRTAIPDPGPDPVREVIAVENLHLSFPVDDIAYKYPSLLPTYKTPGLSIFTPEVKVSGSIPIEGDDKISPPVKNFHDNTPLCESNEYK